MSYEHYSLTRGEKNYELVNHLGNVLNRFCNSCCYGLNKYFPAIETRGLHPDAAR
jgi:hypothetical protein